jgi:hypothetical protein
MSAKDDLEMTGSAELIEEFDHSNLVILQEGELGDAVYLAQRGRQVIFVMTGAWEDNPGRGHPLNKILLLDQDETRLRATADMLGLKSRKIRKVGTPFQSIIMSARAYELAIDLDFADEMGMSVEDVQSLRQNRGK